ncbi:potassium channel family protein [Kitasatospora atroaurantiaca]|nr:potassium channel family protein [Kitasatospora atroaurantiaca]
MLLGPIALLVAFFTLPMGVFGPEHPVLSWVTFGLALAVVAVLLLRKIGQELLDVPGRPGVVILLLSCFSLVVFATAYLALARDPGQFNGLQTRVDALYFTVITMSTVGYGDIYPSGQHAREVVMVQILYTLVFLTAGATAITRRLRMRFADRAATRRRPPR